MKKTWKLYVGWGLIALALIVGGFFLGALLNDKYEKLPPGINAPLTEHYQDNEISFNYPSDIVVSKWIDIKDSKRLELIKHRPGGIQTLMLDIDATIKWSPEAINSWLEKLEKEGSQIKYQNKMELNCGDGLKVIRTWPLQNNKTIDVTEYLFVPYGMDSSLYVLSGQGSTPSFLEDTALSFKFMNCK